MGVWGAPHSALRSREESRVLDGDRGERTGHRRRWGFLEGPPPRRVPPPAGLSSSNPQALVLAQPAQLLLSCCSGVCGAVTGTGRRGRDPEMGQNEA